ncbi:MAG: diacylglycerol kinase, partial [Candidatus Adiutrix sp.]|nr:diacylglycerol kinase [Candidatus Adiutrix sp.]
MLQTFKNIPGRISRAFVYSAQGLKSALLKEESLRLEAAAFVILAVVLLIVPWPWWKKLALASIFVLIPLCELFNSAIEDICDLVSPDYDLHVKNAKDKGSAAVLLAIIINVLA